jgi:hypothetical protein
MVRPGVLAVALALLSAVLLSGCKPPPPAGGDDSPTRPPWLEDVTAEAGLDFVHDAGPVDDRRFLPQIVGSGAALFDFDGDGLLDVYLLNNGGPRGRPNRLFKQLPDGSFKDVSKGSGLDFAGYCMGVTVGDINNDGWPDVLVTGWGGMKLFLNNGDATFTDVTREAGLDNNPLWSTSAAFFDYDRDGWLDLVVVNYLDYDPTWPCTHPSGRPDYCSPKVFDDTASKLYRNLGKQPDVPGRRVPPVRFKDVSQESGLGRVKGPALGVVCADFNGDRWPDIFIANDARPNHLWINQGNGTFKEAGAARGVAVNALGQAEGNMGVAWGDVDGDGLQDLFVTHLGSETNTLWKQGPSRGEFRDRTAASRLHRPRWRGTGFGTVLADLDLDGHLDIALVNGRVEARDAIPGSLLSPHWSRYAERHQVFANDGRGAFEDISTSNPGLCGRPEIGRGLAMGVLSPGREGALDLLTTAIAGPARLYRNVAPRQGHWLLVRVVQPTPNKRGRDALGAELTLRAGGRVWARTAHAGGSYLCSSDPRAHFGLGNVTHADTLEVVWPDGSAEVFAVPGVDRLLELHKGSGKPSRR